MGRSTRVYDRAVSKHRKQPFPERERDDVLGRPASADGFPLPEAIRHLVQGGLQERDTDWEDPLRTLQDAAELRRDIENEKGVYGGDPVAESRRLRGIEQGRVLTQRAASRGGDH